MKKILLLLLFISASSYSQIYTMQNGSFTTCSGTFYDSGGAAGNYGQSQNYQITFCPATPGTYIQLDFTLFDIEGAPFDILKIREGIGTGGAIIPLPSGACASGTVASSHPSGCLTVTFVSDNTIQYAGWAATISCTLIPGGSTPTGPPNAICSGANPFCADAGPLEFPNISNSDCVSDAPAVVVNNTCLLTAPNPAWYYLEIDTPGDLNLLIEQSTGPGGTGAGLDVDFAIWGPFPNTVSACSDFTLGDCTANHNCTGNVIDCSYSIAAIENAVIPNTLVGEVYMVLITNFDGSPGYITMTQTNAGNAGAGSTDCTIVCPTTAGTNPACGASDGYITISGLDPNTSYNVTYLDDGTPVAITLISNAAGIAIILGLNAGNYTNIVTNFVGCTAAFTSVVLTSSPGPVLNPITSNTPICYGNNAIFTLTGTPNTTVTYNINSGGNQTVILNGAGTATVTVSGVTLNTTLTATLITNTVSGCSTILSISHTVVITTAPTATISYASATYCNTATSQTITLTGTGSFTGGTYTVSPAGLAINAGNGTINPVASIAGSYTVTYTLPASGCPTVPATTTVTIVVAPTANINYASPNFCTTAAAQPVVLTGTGIFSGGTYSVSPAGLTINAATGIITPASSTAGNYTVTYTIPASGGCAAVLATTPVTITDPPTAIISYSSANFCSSAPVEPVILVGTAGGTFSVSPVGLFIASNTGTITPSSSTQGTYTVTYTIAASGGCAAVLATTIVTIGDPPTANINYGAATYCTSATAQNITLTGTGGFTVGTYTVSPAGLTINAATGSITPFTSSAGNYTITYTIPSGGACPAVLVTTLVTITAAPAAAISYGSLTYCTTSGPALITLTGTGAYTGGTYTSAPVGLTIDAATGEITPTSSAQGSYSVTYTIPASAGCAAVAVSTTVNVSLTPTAVISYASSTYCTTATPETVTLGGTGIFSGGAYTSSPSGLTIDPTTGEITPSASAAGTYTITYTIPAGGCATIPATTTETITAAPTATISYGSLTYCTTSGPALMTLTGTGAYTGGTYTSAPAGLTIDAATGEITPTSSTQGTYTVTYTIPASAGCAAVAVSTTVNVSLTPTAVISYASSTYCTTATPETVTLGGTGIFSGGAYTSAPAGLTIDPTTGEITPSASAAGTYTITYTIPAGGCATIPATTTATITAAPTATISYGSLTYCTTSGPATITLTGTGAYTGGTYTSAPAGLTLNTATGEITPTSSAQGSYSVTYTIPASAGCAAVAVSTTVNVSLTPTAVISYASSTYCTTATPETVTLGGTGIFSGGAYTSAPAGLTIDPTTGEITPSTSAAGTYTITYTIPAGGCATIPATATATITAAPTATISYGSLTYCTTSGPALMTLTGTGAYTGGTYTSAPAGLTLNTATGEITPTSSAQGSYSVTYTIPASAGCAAVAVSTTVNVSLTPTAVISYASSTYCTTATPETVTLGGTGIFSGGAYTSSPSGLTIDPTTGEITPSASAAGTYTITYTIPAGGCATIPATATATITAAPTATISYGSLTYCTTSGPALMTLTGTGAYTGGTYTSAPAGLTIDAATGEITPSSSAQGSYSVTYTIPASAGCAAVAVSTTVNVSLTPTAAISYASSTYCTTATPETVTLGGTGIFSGGTYTSAPAGLTIDPTTGEITPSTSLAGNYTITYTIPAGGCATIPATTTATITAAPTATISYGSLTYCTTSGPALITLTGTGAYTGGTYNSAPAGLTIDAATGEITPSSSAQGSYSVTYTIPASAGCAAVAVSTTVNVSLTPTAAISYASSTYCTTATPETVTLGGTGIFSGGAYTSAPAGLTIDPTTGEITPSTSLAGNYTITYTIPAGGCATIPATTTATITAAPTATISYGSLTYCTTSGPALMTLTGTGAYTGGTYTSAPAGLTIDAATGEITPSSSAQGSYSVTYTIPASAGCAAVAVSTTVNVSLTPTAAISYASSTYCTTATPETVTLGGTGIFSGGAYTSAPAGLTIDPTTGEITPSTSLAGNYTITYTIPAGGCATIPATTTATITAAPTATISYGSLTYCTTSGPALMTLTGTGAYTGGTYTSAPAGLTLNTATGEITPTSSAQGSYSVTYTIPASAGCAAVAVSTTVNVSLTPTAVISYASSTYCTTATPETVTLGGTGIFSGGAYTSAPAGLTIDPTTGEITPSTSAAGTYTITYTIPAGGCATIPATATATITAAPTATISYGSLTYCTTSGPALMTLTGTGAYTGGTYTSAPAGLTLNTATGEITPTSSAQGSYSVTYTIPASAGCAAVAVSTTVNVTAIPTANINYSASVYCISELPQAVALSGTGAYTGGSYFSTPAGLAIDNATGEINPSASLAGNFVITYTTPAIGGCSSVAVTTSIDITPLPTAIISYPSAIYCTTSGQQTVILTGNNAFMGGNFTVTPSGLTIDVVTGEITPATSTAGTYTVTYIIPASVGCAAIAVNTTVTITGEPNATINYNASNYCISATSQAVVITGTGIISGGTFTSLPTGLTIDFVSGEITPSSSVAGTYAITYTGIASGGCAALIANTTITITLPPTANLDYAGSPYCQSLTSLQSVTLNGTGAYTGGSYSSAPAGLSLDVLTGSIIPSSSTIGTYTVTYTAPASGGCPAVPTTTSVIIAAPATAVFSYAGTPYCKTETSPQSATISGTGFYSGGVYSASPSGLAINAITGAITPATSTPGTYIVTYTIPASGGCPEDSITATVVITAAATANISYLGTPYCQSNSGQQGITLTGTGSYVGGVYSATPSGLTLTTTTGAINPSTSAPGSYIVTYTTPTSGGCAGISVVTTLAITAPPTATINYTASPYCTTVAGAQPIMLSGTNAYAGGTFTASPSGLSINSNTGAIIPSASSAGSYVVTYMILASSGCPADSVSTTVVITAPATAVITYSGTPYCQTLNVPQSVILTGTGAYSGGIYTGLPAGLEINAMTGAITPSTSTAGTYTVTYTTPASGGCDGISVTTSVKITAPPSVAVSYAGSAYCRTVVGGQAITISGTNAYLGGIYSVSPSGLTLNGGTGTITPSSSIAGTYIVTYTTPPSGGCGPVSATTSVIIYPTPTVTATPSLQMLCTGETANVILGSPVSGTTFVWTVQQSNATGASDGSGNNILQTLTTTGNQQGIVTYTVTPSANGCIGIPLTITVRVNPLPLPQLDGGTICINPTTNEVVRTYTFNAGLSDATHDFIWYFNSAVIPGENNNSYIASAAGLYSVAAINNITGCISLPVSANVNEAFVAQSLVINGNTAFVDNPIITVTVFGSGIYEYQLDNGAFQSSNIFVNLSPGTHTITVRDTEGCTDIVYEFVVIGYPHFFTPNGDGYNDTWNIFSLSEQPFAKIHIFDRYGKLIKQISPQGIGWDGTMNGQALPATDYWFTVDYMEQKMNKIFKSHFSLKR